MPLTRWELGEVLSLSLTCAVDLQVLSLVKNVNPRDFPPGARGSSRTLSRPHLPPCVVQWYPGKGCLLAGPRSAGIFYSSKIKASLAWWKELFNVPQRPCTAGCHRVSRWSSVETFSL